MKENDYLLIKEIEKRYGESTIANPMKDWSDEREEEFKKEVEKKILENYKKSKDKNSDKKESINVGCKECGRNFSPKFIDQIHIKKYGLCFECYTKRHY